MHIAELRTTEESLIILFPMTFLGVWGIDVGWNGNMRNEYDLIILMDEG